jgi:hypothetical protein
MRGAARSARHVRLLESPARPPATAAEREAIATLRLAGTMPFLALVDRLAREAYGDALRGGAWAADIGLFGTALFVPEVARALEAGNGVLWAIETPGEVR